jgi:rubrerythrin
MQTRSQFEETTVFTISDIRNIAIQIERNGEETYRAASRLADDPAIASVLTHMAEDETRHAKWFESIQSTKPLTAEQKEMEQIGRVLLQDMIKGNAFLLQTDVLTRAELVEDVLAQAQNFEADTVLFYEFLLGFIDEEETKSALAKIIAEERNHLAKLKAFEQGGLEDTAIAAPA